ncbi:ATP-dependent DNA helicase PIF1 [Linum perenne]
MLDEYNILTKTFRQVRASLEHSQNKDLRLRITGQRIPNGKQYELPSGVELAGLQRITSLHPLFDSLHFPLLFPYGNDGFHNCIKYNPIHIPRGQKRQHVTQREYYCFRIQYRNAEGSTLIRGGKTLQHYCIDAFTTVEQNRLTYLRNNQKALRSEIYSSKNIGRIILPSSFTGGMRYMKQLFLDAMAICHYFGNPDLFITFTNKPAIVARVFRMKLQHLKDDINDRHIFGRTVAAQLPNPTEDPIGYASVTKFMIHGPCGIDNPKSPCMVDGKCKKKYPKAYNTETISDRHGYTLYKREKTKITVNKSGKFLDNRYIVPYNRHLIIKYQAHINIEICHKGQLIKYLFKYITKGPDRSQTIRSIVGRPGITNTMLTQWFVLNQRDPSARKYTYDKIPNAYVWSTQLDDWSPRKQGFAVGRIPSVPAASGDIFYLRMLLGKISGALNFKDLRTLNGIVYDNYQQTCQAMGLLSSDNEWDLVMSEISRWAHPAIIRSIISKVRSTGGIALVVASSGIAATLLPDGVTAHSRFKIPLEIDNLSTCTIKKGSDVAELLKSATLIVWDEAPMIHKLSFEAVDRTMCDIIPSKIYFSSDSLSPIKTNIATPELEYPLEFLNSLSFNGIPEHKLELKPFTVVMLLRNINPTSGMCNGTRILLTDLGEYVISGLIVSGTQEGTTVAIPRIILDVTDNRWPFTLRRRQFPIRICYAMTINKSQGQTLDHVGIYLPKPVFSHGQLYVAVSRVRSANGLHILIPNISSNPDNKTRNIVYQDILHEITGI